MSEPVALDVNGSWIRGDPRVERWLYSKSALETMDSSSGVMKRSSKLTPLACGIKLPELDAAGWYMQGRPLSAQRVHWGDRLSQRRLLRAQELQLLRRDLSPVPGSTMVAHDERRGSSVFRIDKFDKAEAASARDFALVR